MEVRSESEQDSNWHTRGRSHQRKLVDISFVLRGRCLTLRWSSGYDARLTRERSPVQSWDEVLIFRRLSSKHLSVVRKKRLTAVGFEPTPLRTSALSWRLRPLGHAVGCPPPKAYDVSCLSTQERSAFSLTRTRRGFERSHSSVGQSVRLITVRSAVQARVGASCVNEIYSLRPGFQRLTRNIFSFPQWPFGLEV